MTFTSTKQAFSDYIIDEIATALAASKNIQVIDRQHTDAIRKEFNIQFSGDVSDDEVKRVGRQLGAQFVVTGSLVDIGNAYRFRVAAINIETAVREGSSSLNININDPQVVFLLTGQRTAPAVTTPGNSGTYNIGDIGPGGGFIFFAEGGVYKECSGDLGRYNWNDAIEVAKKHRGGGFSNWYLPDRGELGLMYRNLKQNDLGNFSDSCYWSSTEINRRRAYYLYFKNGYIYGNDSDDWRKDNGIFPVRAVRTFSK